MTLESDFRYQPENPDLPRWVELEQTMFPEGSVGPHHGEELKQYLTLPEDSFGRQVFGAILVKDLPRLRIPLADLGLSASAQQELKRYPLSLLYYGYYGIWRRVALLVQVDLKRSSLSPEARKEIGEALQRVVKEKPQEAKDF